MVEDNLKSKSWILDEATAPSKSLIPREAAVTVNVIVVGPHGNERFGEPFFHKPANAGAK